MMGHLHHVGRRARRYSLTQLKVLYGLPLGAYSPMRFAIAGSCSQ